MADDPDPGQESPGEGSMPKRLRAEEVLTIQVLAEKGQANTAIARALGVTEGNVRYHVRRVAAGATDGRGPKPFAAESHAAVIEGLVERGRQASRPVNLREMFEQLVHEHQYPHSYKSLVRFMRRKYGKPKIRTYRRVETPPGAQTQTDWGEYPCVRFADGWRPMHAFHMVLSHSRMPAVVWSRMENQLSWLHCHNEAYRRLGGVAAVNRIDNLKTGIARGAGAWGIINPAYQSYACAVGFHVDACEARAANAKGKVEAKVRLGRLCLDPREQVFETEEELQSWTDARVKRWATRAICPATGLSVQESWENELARLPVLPLLPEPFDVALTRTVHLDCKVNFEGRQYAVPFELVNQQVEVRGCASTVQVLARGKMIRQYPRHTAERILIDPKCYEGPETADVLPPRPLGRMGRRLQEIMDLPVEKRPLDLYRALAEVAR